MLNKIIAFSIKNKLVIGLFTIALIFYGSYEFTKLPIDAVPDITNNQVQVITITPSLAAPDVERLVTFPIEQANSNIPGLKEIRSFSRFGLSIITIVFNDDIDVYWARQQVAERLQQVKSQIPKDIGEPSLAPVTTGLGEIYQYVIRPKPGYETKYSIIELRTIQDWIVRRQLIGVDGVADVSSFGGKLKQYEIAIDAGNLKSHGITINDVFAAVEKNNENTGGAYIEKKSTVLYIRSDGLIGSIDDIKNTVVKNTSNGTPLLISDVADVRIGNAIRYGAMTYNDEGEVAGAVVMMLKGANSNEVISNVKNRIKQIERTLPEGVEIQPFLDRTKMVNNAIGTVSKNLTEGALIVIFVLVLFLGNFRAGFLVASIIPLAMLFAIIMMNTFGVSGNLMSLGALDFGLIVDGAVIIVEAVMHQLAHKKFAGIAKISQNEMDKEVMESSGRMMNSAVFGQLIILVVYLPIFSLQNIEGKMFKPMAQTVAFALLGAFLLSLTYVPVMSAAFLSKKTKHKKNISDRMMDFLENIQQNLLRKVLAIPKTVVVIVVSLFVIAVFVLTNLGGEFIPALEEGDFAIETRVLAGSNINTTIDACLKSAQVLNKFPEVEKVIGKIGSGEIPTDPMPMEAADLMVILKDKSEWVSAKTFDGLAQQMSEALKDIPGVTFSFQFPVQMRFNELMTGAKQDVVCKIFGENLDTLAKYATLLGNLVREINGAQNIYVEPITGLPQLVIEYKRNLMAQYGLNIQDVNRVVNMAFAGQSSGLVYEDEKRFDLVVRLAGERRQELSDVKNLLIPTPIGTQIPLYQVADVTIKESINQIQRDDAKRRITVGFNVRERDVQSTVNDLQAGVAAKIKLPVGYYITYGGSFENLIAAKKRLTFAVPVSLLLIFLLLYFAFNSLKQGLLIYSAIPLSAIGGILFLALRGMPFSISAGVGFIALFGVAVLNGIVLIAEFNRIKAAGETDIKQIVMRGTKLRLRPVLMTALVASLGFLPMAISNGAGAEVQRPLATVVIGGLLIATLLTLFVLPILYILFEKKTSLNIKPKQALSVLAALFFIGQNGFSQTPISLKAAIDTALVNNLRVKNEKLKSEYQRQLIKTAANIPPALVVGEYGQINSSYYDNRFGFGQNINFPTVYSNQKTVLKQEWQNAVLNVAVQQTELKKQVSLVYYSLIYLLEKQKLLESTDSSYALFLKKATQRFLSGESNILEKITAETQRGQIALQLKQINSDIGLLQLQFQLLLNSNVRYIPLVTEFKLAATTTFDTSQLVNHPLLKMYERQKLISSANLRLEKSKLLPDLSIEYSNMSMRGTGSDNVTYGGSTRFQSAQIGVGIPLFFGSQATKIKAAKTNELIAKNSFYAQVESLSIEYQKALSRYKHYYDVVAYLETSVLPNTNIITGTANLQHANGDINYLDWVMLINQATHIKSDYLNAVNSLNESIILLNYFTNN